MTVALNEKDQLNAHLKLFWIACGKGDFLLPQNEELIKSLTEKGIQYEWHLTEGDHSWPVWRGYLSEFLPRLFR